jgi:hypothetical protein
VEFSFSVSPPIKHRRQDLQVCESVMSSPSSHGGMGRSRCCSCSLPRSRWCSQAAASSRSLRGGQDRRRAQLPQGRPSQAPRRRSCSTSYVEALSEPRVGVPVFLPSSGFVPDGVKAADVQSSPSVEKAEDSIAFPVSFRGPLCKFLGLIFSLLVRQGPVCKMYPPLLI